MTITVSFSGLEPVVEALNNLANAIMGAKLAGVQPSQSVIQNQAASPVGQNAPGQYQPPTSQAPVSPNQYQQPAAPAAGPAAPQAYPLSAPAAPTVNPTAPQAYPQSAPTAPPYQQPGAPQQYQGVPSYQQPPVLQQNPAGPPFQQPPTGGVPTSHTAQAYTPEQLAVAMTSLVDAGKLELVLSILQQFGVSALTEVPPNRYSELAVKLREAGAAI